MSAVAQTIPGVDVGQWMIRNRFDRAAVALADRHYSRRPDKIGSNQLGGVGRALTLVSPCERALWVTRYLLKPMDDLDAWRCSYFRNEGAGLSSDLILEAMALTREQWSDTPPDGWVTWIDKRKVRSTNPGYCFLMAGWNHDTDYRHRYLIRLRAPVLASAGKEGT